MTGYAFPVKGYRGPVALHWGTHLGAADLFAPEGTPVLAMHDGRVIYVGNDALGGHNVLIRGDDELTSYYAHLYRAPLVSPWQRVTAGQQIGGVGASGNAATAGPHLHVGMGRAIASGSGPAGGAGTDFDLTSLLRQLLMPADRRPRFRVLADDLRLRVSPGTTEAATVLAELDAGTIVEATVTDSFAWRRVRAPDGSIGWVADRWLEEV